MRPRAGMDRMRKLVNRSMADFRPSSVTCSCSAQSCARRRRLSHRTSAGDPRRTRTNRQATRRQQRFRRAVANRRQRAAEHIPGPEHLDHLAAPIGEELVEHHCAIDDLKDGTGLVAFEKNDAARPEGELPSDAGWGGPSASMQGTLGSKKLGFLRNVVLRNVRGPLDDVEQRLHGIPQRMTAVIRVRGSW